MNKLNIDECAFIREGGKAMPSANTWPMASTLPMTQPSNSATLGAYNMLVELAEDTIA